MKTVVFGPNDRMYDKGTGIFYDVIKNPDIEYYCFFPDLKKSRQLAIAFSNKVTKYIPWRIRKALYYKVLGHKYLKNCKRSDEIMFVFSMYKMEDEHYFDNFLSFLKFYYVKAKFVYYSFDIASTWYRMTPEYVKRNFDLVMTFDKLDAEAYGFEFYEGIYSGVDGIEEQAKKENISSDVMFIGADKGKFPILLNIFKYLSDAGKKCDFRLVSVDKETEEQLRKEYECEDYNKGFRVLYKGSAFTVNDYCPYYKTLPVIAGAKCMLDVPLGTQSGSTIRLQEAVTYHKKLITNLKEVKEKPYYNENNFLVFERVEDINPDFIDKPYEEGQEYSFSPLKMIEYAKEKLYK